MIKIPLETFSYVNQSDSILGTDLIRHSKWNKDGKESEFTKSLEPESMTIFDAFRCGAAHSRGGKCLGWRNTQLLPFQWVTYDEVLLRAQNFGCGLLNMGLRPGENTRVAIFAKNCPEWVIAEHGLFCYSMVSVPLYDLLGPDAISFIIKECDIRIIVAMDGEKVTAILNSNPPACLKAIVTIRDASPQVVR